jgi:2-keto-4-pentenoate hydratase/2-oxohepta-3-ene-1,7-dioic acid hydratase in catechol pathway
MRLARYGNAGAEKPALVDEAGVLRSLDGIVADIDADTVTASGLQRLREVDPRDLPVVDGYPRLGPCIRGTGKIIGVGMNYRDHARQAGVGEPQRPVFFAKPLSSLCGACDDVVLPIGSHELDWEVELAVIIGAEVRNAGQEEAEAAIAGYCILNDLTERGWIRESGQLFDGKYGDTFSPLGPWMVTADEVPDPEDLSLQLWLNDELRQSGTTADMIFKPADIIRRLSRITTLHPGDILATGTPAGTGMRSQPPTYLQPGDRLRLQIDGLGTQAQKIASPAFPR